MREEDYNPAKGIANMIVVVLIAGALIVGLFGFASSVAPIIELSERSQEER